MRIFVYITGALATVLYFFGRQFIIRHWPYGRELYYSGIGFAILFGISALVFIFYKRDSRNGSKSAGIRFPTKDELKLLEFLIKRSSSPISHEWMENLRVCPMNDGGMGSLYLLPKNISQSGRMIGKMVSEYEFKDKDEVHVIVSLYLDQNGELFEIDIFKTDFSELSSLPVHFPST